ncbi:hypothetical protein ERO13_A01G068150v2 [Gossypium hirsutum]|nr:hypothetical protein ERO13_A01G068150v2 [Gossypium hirsutum]
MRALLVMVCILLASTLFIPTSTMARQLGEKDINDPPVFTTPNCGCGKPYKNCIPLQLLLRSHPVPFITATAAKSSQLNLECNGQAIGSIGEIVM